MPENRLIEQRITAILARSGLCVDRRQEVAEELRGHFEQLVSAKQDQGLPEEQAVEAALADFGPPDVIRKQLRRQQRMLDRRYAFAELRRQIWLPVLFSGFFAILCAVASPETDSLLKRCVGGCSLFVCMFFLVSLFMYVASVFECQIKRLRPREEFSFLKSFVRWAIVVDLSLAGVIVLTMVTIISVAPLLNKNPFVDHYPRMILYYFWVAWIESAVRNFLVCVLGVLGFGLGLAIYERSRCVDAVPTAVAG